ncbi:hypothetical protein QO034_05120 [Sedimentitalea sp. JM2-8]|uniref:Lipoprotein n=1 Tax=Sedimentitalea xiamensis TaxID=3050037 RepID=A0ABT7FBK2_9RHOB|nr:hypothetical protein [Sedimentitalea xiamensis]MDK3072487.1 hypothetical protein [Sedimentitalea xiamensis]
MSPRAALILGLLCIATSACTTQDMVTSTGKARFADYPDSLVAALQRACDSPSQTFLRPTPSSVECREFLPPEPTAAIILTYDGTPENLPELVIHFETRADGSDFIVENEVFLHVPQKKGPALKVRQSDVGLNRMLDALYTRAGGVPE